MADLSRSLQIMEQGGGLAHYTTSKADFSALFSLDFSPFTRRYSENLILISFPRPTQMFPFGRFPFPYREYPSFRWVGPPIRGSSDRQMLAPPRGLSQLATPFFGDRAEPSTKRRIMSGSFPTATEKITHILCRCSFLLILEKIAPFARDYISRS